LQLIGERDREKEKGAVVDTAPIVYEQNKFFCTTYVAQITFVGNIQLIKPLCAYKSLFQLIITTVVGTPLTNDAISRKNPRTKSIFNEGRKKQDQTRERFRKYNGVHCSRWRNPDTGCAEQRDDAPRSGEGYPCPS